MLRYILSASMLLAVPTAHAQTAPAAQGLGGAPVAGVCLLSREALIANAKVGIAVSARLKQLSAAAQSEVDAQRAPIAAEVQAFQAQAATLTPAVRAQREQALATRAKPVQALAEQRSREIEATRAKALQRISAEAQPGIAQVYTQHKCGLLVDRNTVLGGNFQNDLTAEAVKALDDKITTFAIEREVLAAAPSATGTRP